MELKDTFNGNDKHLVACIKALLEMDETGALVPHGVGGQARVMLSAAAVRLDAYREAKSNKNIGSNFDDFLADEGILKEVTDVAKKRVEGLCNLGMECEKHGVCYAEAQGAPEKCGKYDAFEAVVRAYGEACRRSTSATEMNEKLKMVLAFHNPDGVASCVAAIQFAIENEFDEGMQFLRCWNEANFEACREEWPEAPDECYIGADQTFKPKCAEG